MADNTRAVAGPLYNLLPPDDDFNSNDLLGRFLEYVTGKGLTLYPAQEEAILELFEDKNVILNTPTGSGKSLVASALHFDSLARKRRSVYTCPIKALVNEKWRTLCRELGPENVGPGYGGGFKIRPLERERREPPSLPPSFSCFQRLGRLFLLITFPGGTVAQRRGVWVG
jgi:CRISPR/Cas system-associated endonuclease/helicase Cas3